MENCKKTALRRIARYAHKITRATIGDYPGADYRATLGAAMADLLDGITESAPATVETPAPGEPWRIDGDALTLTAAAEWRLLKDAERVALLERAYRHVKRLDDAGIMPDGSPRAQVMTWVRDDDDRRAVVHGAYVRLVDRLEAGPVDVPLFWAACRAVRAEGAAIQRAERRNPLAVTVYVDDDGGEHESIDLDAAPMVSPPPAPEASAVIHDLIQRACRDRIDRIIAAGLAQDQTQATIATRAGIGQAAVCKRRDAIKARLDLAAYDVYADSIFLECLQR